MKVRYLLHIDLFLFVIILLYFFVFNLGTIGSFLYAFILFFFLQKVIFKNKEFDLRNLFVFLLYTLLAILFYEIQKNGMPNWKGLTGPYGGIGTDDSRFYAAITNNYKELPIAAQTWGDLVRNHSYSKFLRLLYPFNVTNPLQVIIPNIIGIVFIPFFGYKLAYHLLNDNRVANLTYVLSIFCPMVLANGLILVRDGWTAFLFIVGIYYLLKDKRFFFILTFVFLFYIRVASAGLLLLTALLYTIYKHRNFKISFITFAVVLLAIIGSTLFFSIYNNEINTYISEKGLSLFGRSDFLEDGFLSKHKESTIYRILTLPFPLNNLLGIVFFLFLPFLNFNSYVEGHFVPRKFLLGSIMPILFLIYNIGFFAAIIKSFLYRERKIVGLFLILLFNIFIISNYSLQIRHKTMVMPIYYIIIASGFAVTNNSVKLIAIVLSILFFIFQLFYLVI